MLRLLMIDALHPVRVPSGEEEALRDVVCAREAVRGDLMRARQRLSKLLLVLGAFGRTRIGEMREDPGVAR